MNFKCVSIVYVLILNTNFVWSDDSYEDIKEYEKMRLYLLDDAMKNPPSPTDVIMKNEVRLKMDFWKTIRDRFILDKEHITNLLKAMQKDAEKNFHSKDKVKTAIDDGIIETIKNIEAVSSKLYMKFNEMETQAAPIFVRFLIALVEKRESFKKKLTKDGLESLDVELKANDAYRSWTKGNKNCAKKFFGTASSGSIEWTLFLEDVAGKWLKLLHPSQNTDISDEKIIEQIKAITSRSRMELNTFARFAPKFVEDCLVEAERCAAKILVSETKI